MIKVFLVAGTIINGGPLHDYLVETGLTPTEADDYVVDRNGMQSADVLAEAAGRLCYASWKPGLNANVTKIRNDTAEYLRNVIVKQGHGSVLEHASFTFIFTGISRVLTHELITHRVGMAKSQQSMRYVRISDVARFKVRDTPDIPPHIRESLDNRMMLLLESLQEAEALLGIDDGNFENKKALTSSLRSFAPQGILTEIMWTANVRTLRYVIESRTALGAEIEIRELFDKVAALCVENAPLCFADFQRHPDGVWAPERSKV